MNVEKIYCGDRAGTFYVGVSPDNVAEFKYRYLDSAKRQAQEWSEETGIKFFVYEQVTVYKPVS